jgi:hypothetical protein
MQTGYAVSTAADLRAIPANRRIDGMAKTIIAKKKWYQYDAIVTGVIDDGDTILIPDDSVGAWLVMHPSSGGGDGGGGGGSAVATVQNGKPTGAADTGAIVADSRSDRGILWTKTASDWQVFGSRPIYRSISNSTLSSDYYGDIDIYASTITSDFAGQILVIYKFSSVSSDAMYVYYYISVPEIVTTRTSGSFIWIELRTPFSTYPL